VANPARAAFPRPLTLARRLPRCTPHDCDLHLALLRAVRPRVGVCAALVPVCESLVGQASRDSSSFYSDPPAPPRLPRTSFYCRPIVVNSVFPVCRRRRRGRLFALLVCTQLHPPCAFPAGWLLGRDSAVGHQSEDARRETTASLNLEQSRPGTELRAAEPVNSSRSRTPLIASSGWART